MLRYRRATTDDVLRALETAPEVLRAGLVFGGFESAQDWADDLARRGAVILAGEDDEGIVAVGGATPTQGGGAYLWLVPARDLSKHARQAVKAGRAIITALLASGFRRVHSLYMTRWPEAVRYGKAIGLEPAGPEFTHNGERVVRMVKESA